jgi:predicted permease
VLSRLGSTLTPLALVSIGLQFRLDTLRGNRGPLVLGVGYKLVIGPLLILLLYVGSLGLRGTTLKVTLFEAAMGPMIGSSIVAVEYGLDGPLVSLVVGFGTLASFITLPLWWEWLEVLSLK